MSSNIKVETLYSVSCNINDDININEDNYEELLKKGYIETNEISELYPIRVNQELGIFTNRNDAQKYIEEIKKALNKKIKFIQNVYRNNLKLYDKKIDYVIKNTKYNISVRKVLFIDDEYYNLSAIKRYKSNIENY